MLYLGKIIKSAGSRIGILADEVICNHDLRFDTGRLHWPCDLSQWRTSTFRKAWNCEACTEGNVEKIGKASSSSSPILTQTYLTSGNRVQKGKTRLEYKTLRTTPQKWIWPTGNWGIPLLTWMWILISVTMKSAHMHSWRTKLWKRNSQIRIQSQWKYQNWFKQNLCSRRSGEGEDGV